MIAIRILVSCFVLLTATFAWSQGGDGTRGGGDTCEVSYRTSLALALVWLRNNADGEWSVTGKKIRPFLKSRFDTSRSAYRFEFDILSSERLSIRCTHEPQMIGTTEKTAISEMRSPYPNAPFAERYFSTVINWKRWQDTRNPLERVALACHEIMVLAGVEKTDNYQVCNRILRSDRIVSSRHYQLACHSSNREGNQLYSLRLRWVDQGTWLVSFESRHSPEGKKWKDGHRRGSRGWFRYIAETDEAPPDPAIEAPWEGRTWQRLEPVARYDMHMTTDCHFGRRDPRQLDCGKAMKNSLELMATEEAFTSSFLLEKFPGLEDWLRKHTDIALEVDHGVLKLRHYLMYSPADFGGEIADLSHYQECQTMLNGFSDP